MTRFENGKPALAALADGDLETVNGGCVGVPVETRGGGIIYVSPTTGYPNPNGGPLPYFPFGRPFPV